MGNRMRVALTSGSLVLASFGAWGTPVAAAEPQTFTVNSAGDGPDLSPGDGICDASEFGLGTCTLRAAIGEANATPARDRIEFRIGGANATGVKTIDVGSSLTVSQPLVIAGYSQPGAHANTAAHGTNAALRVILDGPGTSSAVGLLLRAPTVVRGLVIVDFRFGIAIAQEGAGSIVAGDFLGTDATGTTAVANERGIQVAAAARVGGTDRADRNLISGNRLYGIEVDSMPAGSTPAHLLGNLIGTRANGSAALGNGDGINVNEGQVNGHVLIGGSTAAARNIIAFNRGAGVLVRDDTSVAIRGNSIFRNGGLGIDLYPAGPTANDHNPPLDQFPPPDTDTGANDLQNHPVVTSAKSGSSATTIKGSLRSTTNRSFRIEFFANPSDQEQARTSRGSIVVKTDGFGLARFRFVPASKVPLGRQITATATDLSDDETSEISAPRTVVRP